MKNRYKSHSLIFTSNINFDVVKKMDAVKGTAMNLAMN